MSRSGKPLLFWLRRCVAARSLTFTLSAGLKTRGGVASGRCGLTEQPTWAAANRAWGLLRLQPVPTTFQNGLCTKASCEEEYPPLPAYQSEPEPATKEVYIVQVKGLPWSCTAQDLLQFFSDCRIREGVSGIHLTVDRQGRATGRAFIEMESEGDVSKALEKHRQYLGPRYVEVFEVTNSDAEAILKKAIQTPDTRVVRIRGLPFTCTEADIINFFSGLEILENGITVVTDHKGRKSGEAYVWFSTQEAADEALQRDREVMGRRYIEVFPSGSNEIHSGWRSSASPKTSGHHGRTAPAAQPASRTPPRSSLPPHFIHMRGLPFQVSGEDIVKFFFPLAVAKILIECGPDGRPSGEADVYFSRHQDALEAMSRDRQHIGERYIELFLNSLPEGDGR